MAAESATNGRAAMLARLVTDVRRHGLPPDPSLRQFADRLGTSHRMLAYYFSSLDGLLATVLATMRAQERETLASLAAGKSLREAVEAMWAYYTDEARAPEHRAFFYVFAQALREPAAYEDFLASLDAWVVITAGLADAEGRPEATAQLLVSGVRGLLMDRLTSADPGPIDAAFEYLLDALLAR